MRTRGHLREVRPRSSPPPPSRPFEPKEGAVLSVRARVPCRVERARIRGVEEIRGGVAGWRAGLARARSSPSSPRGSKMRRRRVHSHRCVDRVLPLQRRGSKMRRRRVRSHRCVDRVLPLYKRRRAQSVVAQRTRRRSSPGAIAAGPSRAASERRARSSPPAWLSHVPSETRPTVTKNEGDETRAVQMSLTRCEMLRGAPPAKSDDVGR